jgi:hypothetical protein
MDRLNPVICASVAALCAVGALLFTWPAGARADDTAPAAPVLPLTQKQQVPEDVLRCATAVERVAKGHPEFNGFEWDRNDPKKYIHSTVMLETEFRGKLVPVDYTLILVGRLRERKSGHLVEGSGSCGMRGGQIIAAHILRSPTHE